MTRAELIAAVEAGETGEHIREGVALAFGWEQHPANAFWWRPPCGEWQRLLPARELLIDAQAALPGRIVEVRNNDAGTAWYASTLDRFGEGRAPAEPAARLAALLRALPEDVHRLD